MRETDQGTQTLSDGRYVGTHPAVYVMAASVGEREGANKFSNEFTGWETQYLGCIPFGSMVGLMVNLYAVGDHGLRLDCPSRAATRTDQRVCVAEKTLDG